eukprot:COSAG01_NODE_14476_length_1449_cov_1.718519_2_plen_212_part_00
MVFSPLRCLALVSFSFRVHVVPAAQGAPPYNLSSIAAADELGLARCNPSEPRQQWCMTEQRQVRDVWGRCLTRASCSLDAGSAVVHMGVCGAETSNCGGQSWYWDPHSHRFAARIKGAIHEPPSGTQCIGDGKNLCECLDISSERTQVQTFPCKDPGKGNKGKCEPKCQKDVSRSHPLEFPSPCPRPLDLTSCFPAGLWSTESALDARRPL